MRSTLFSLGLATAFAALPAQAATIGLTLTPDTDPLLVAGGETITWTVGVSPETVITGYVLDVRYDRSELTYLGAEQLVPFFAGAFVPPFQTDPGLTPGDAGSTGLASSDSGRASYIGVNDSELVGSIFALTFMVNNPPQILDGLPDLMVGILDPTADAVAQGLGQAPFDYDVATVSVSVGTVPEPSSLLLIASSLTGLIALRRRRS